jgi:hypothetical protein
MDQCENSVIDFCTWFFDDSIGIQIPSSVTRTLICVYHLISSSCQRSGLLQYHLHMMDVHMTRRCMMTPVPPRPPQIPRIGDTGYIGTTLKTPHKKPKGGELTTRQKKSNHRLSSKRVSVEHGIGKMKIWRVAKDIYRNHLSGHILMMKNIAGLHNLM